MMNEVLCKNLNESGMNLEISSNIYLENCILMSGIRESIRSVPLTIGRIKKCGKKSLPLSNMRSAD